MFDSSYDFKYLMSEKKQGELYVKLHTFTFKCKKKHSYIFLAEEYDNHLYAVKFFLESHRFSKKRYQLVTAFNDPFAILGTCLKIFNYILQHQNTYASFIFSGAPLLSEDADENTKRIRIYRRIVENTFNPVNWYHYSFPGKNIYMLVNAENESSETLVNWATEMLQTHYEF